MSLNHGPQSLPSFAQAFSSQSLSSMSAGNNALPPIQTRLPPMEHRRVRTPISRPASEDIIIHNKPAPSTNRKRPRNDVSREDDRSNSDHSASPRLIHIKEEQDQDQLDPSPTPPPARSDNHRLVGDNAGAPPPSSLRPSPSKKRRVTISGAPHPLNTDVRAPVDQTNSTPISPVVMGFTIKRDNPSAIEQVKSMITVKQKQKALIEQRRGSVAGVMSPSTITTNPPLPSTPADERSNLTSSKLSTSARPLRRSPNNGASTRRLVNPTHTGNNPRPPSPSPLIVPSQQPTSSASNPVANSQSLPPPPISFAKRRAEQLGSSRRKPADILISPREAQTHEQFQPAIQSAPPIPHAGQGSSFLSGGRFPMALPRLPAVMGGGDNVRRVATNVPPTPTRLSMQRNAPGPVVGVQPVAGISGRSPPAASVPIASTLVPPTPGLFHHPGYNGDKAAFLAPFEVFYDALNDSKQLKVWLGEQLQRSNAMMQSLTQQQEKLNEVVESLVQKQVAGVRSEMVGLQRRVEELEDALRSATSGRRRSTDINAANPRHHKGNKTPLRNGITIGPVASDSYTFPPVPVPSSSSLEPPSRRRPDLPRRPSSPGWGQDPREKQGIPDTEIGSPAPMNIDSVPRLSVSASRLDVSRSQQHPLEAASSSHSQAARSSPRLPFGIQSPPQIHAVTSPPALQHGKSPAERPSLSRQQSSSHGPSPSDNSQQQQTIQSPPLKRAESRRNSVIMSPPEAPANTTTTGDD